MSKLELLKKYKVTSKFRGESKEEVRGFLKDFVLADGIDDSMFEIEKEREGEDG